MVLEIECRDGVPGDELTQRVGAHFVSQLGLQPEVTAVAPGTLPRFELKARRFFVE